MKVAFNPVISNRSPGAKSVMTSLSMSVRANR